ncbi:MAG: DUF1080 domain-containing protein, partial [Verrucomicrobiota bacterium]
MKVPGLLILLAASASAAPWKEIFKPMASWEAAASVTAEDTAIRFEKDPDGKFFTNASNPKKAGYLQTAEAFGDCTVEAEFMIPAGSNSGIYLMGRYEIQILDSHGKDKVGSSDMGGVYQRWDNQRQPKGFEGVAPSENAANPPGEWQTMVIRFRAPRFDADGKLLEKPRFLSVTLNGKLVQQNVTLSGPTRAAQRKGFVARDAVFIQGDHGPIAFRKFKVTP